MWKEFIPRRPPWLWEKKYGQSMPIVEQVNQVLFEGKAAREAVNELMIRDKRVEASGLMWKGYGERTVESTEK